MPINSLNQPLIIDLFSGAGGLSLGASRAGFCVAGAAELDAKAIETHAKNFPNTKHLNIDLLKFSSSKILNELGLKKGQLSGIVGGPPCQGFSTMGHRNVHDVRNDLFVRFFKIVGDLKPNFFVAENVMGILDDQYFTIRNKAFSYVKDYRMLEPLIVKANEYGAPTTRTRVFFIGYKARKVKAMDNADFINIKESSENFVRVKYALAGLPSGLEACINGKGVIGNCNKDKLVSFYRRLSGFIPEGIGDVAIIDEYKNKNIVTGCIPTKHIDKVKQRFRELSCGKQDKISKAIKLDPEGFCPTLRAGTGPDRGSYQAVRPIHYAEPRVITPREAARLQGFPDWFDFHSTIWHSFRQIGNSVSPIVAEKVLSVIYHKVIE